MEKQRQNPRGIHSKTSIFLTIMLAVLLSLLQTQVSRGAAYTVQFDPTVAGLISQVNQGTLYTYVAGLSGSQPVTIGGSSYSLSTRNTGSGTPIQKATQYAYEYLLAQPGLDSVSYDTWAAGGFSNRNVIGTLTGSTRPGEIILLTAHIDNMPNGSLAPGADDNASGSAALMLAAKLLSQHTFERTIRFVFFTGEEQGLYGSNDYAKTARAAGENIVAVVNLDMLGWESDGDPTMRVHTRPASTGAKDLEIANLFVSVVNTYNIDLSPIITSYGMADSDHGSFWSQSYPAVCIIEDDGDQVSWGDFNPNYHTTADTLARLDMPYFTQIVAATVGSVAHLAFLNEGATATLTAIPTITDTPGPLPGDFAKTSPANTATGQPVALSLAWQNSDTAASYEYCYDTSNDNACSSGWLDNGAATSASLDGLLPGVSYYWQARAVNANGATYANSGTWWSFRTQPVLVTKSFSSSGAQDGWLLESSETSSLGGKFDSLAYTFNVGDDATKKQYRGLLSFSTGPSLPDNAVITGVTLKVRKQVTGGTGDPFTLLQGLLVDIKPGFFGTSSALAVSDFQAVAGKTLGPFSPTLLESWYSFDLTAAKASINKLGSNSGLTQVRLRFKLDDNNNGIANFIRFYSGNSTTIAYRPVLLVKYYVP